MRILLIATITAALALSAALAADTAPAEPPAFKMPQAAAAKTRHDKAVANAEDAFIKALILARQNYVRDLETAMAAATRAGNLDEALAIKTEKETTEQDLKELQGLAPIAAKITKEVPATEQWTSVCKVRFADQIKITATGDVFLSFGGRGTKVSPDGHDNKRTGDGTLIGRLNGKEFTIGSGGTYRMPEAGMLEMRVRDKQYDDNGGAFTVTVQLLNRTN